MIAPKQSRALAPVRLSFAGTEDGRKPIARRDYLSHSQVTSYQACPLKWWFTYVVGAKPECLAGSLLFGASVHAAIQRHLEALIACDTPPTLEDLIAVYREHWRIEAGNTPIQYPKGSDAESTTETARHVLTCFMDSPLAKPKGQILGIEETLRVPLGMDLPDLLARVDLIEYRDGEVVITDFKTSRSAWSADAAEDHSDQLTLYGYAAQPIAAELQATVRLQFIVLTKGKTPKIDQFTVPYAEERMERCRIVMRQVFRCMTNDIVYPSPSPLSCSCCPYPRQCKDWHRRRQP